MFYQKRFQRIVPSYFASVLIMFAFAVADGVYRSAGAGIADLAAHLSFTFTFFPDTYMYTPLNGVLWTIGIEAQFYLLFPVLVRFMRKNSALNADADGCCRPFIPGWVWARYNRIFPCSLTSFRRSWTYTRLECWALSSISACGAGWRTNP